MIGFVGRLNPAKIMALVVAVVPGASVHELDIIEVIRRWLFCLNRLSSGWYVQCTMLVLAITSLEPSAHSLSMHVVIRVDFIELNVSVFLPRIVMKILRRSRRLCNVRKLAFRVRKKRVMNRKHRSLRLLIARNDRYAK